MISPSNTYDGLTTGSPETQPGEPAKYYPTDQPTYFRLTPATASRPPRWPPR